MNISARKQIFLDAVLLAERLTGKKESLPVLSCIVIDVGNKCIVRATNLEAGVEIDVPCDVKEKGIVAASAGILAQIVRSISGDVVSLKIEDGNLLVESRGTKTLIKTVSPEEFPVIGGGDMRKGATLPRDGLIVSLQSVSYAASPSMIRPELGSIFLSSKPHGLVCVATDSFRLAEKTIPNIKESAMSDVLIPLKHAGELLHVLEKMDGETVEIAAEDSQLVVFTHNVRFVSRIVDGSFPNYREIIPKEAATEATLLKADFVDMLRKARIFSGKDQQVGLHVYPSRKKFSATARDPSVGEMSDSLDAALSGDDLDINFHIGYLADCLSSIGSDSVTLSFAGIGRPLVIRGVSDPSFLYLVMPLNR